MTPVLSVDELEVTAGPVTIIADVAFVLRPGERVGLIGESGSGKTMTALAITGLLPEGLTARGRVSLEGTDLLGRPEREVARLRGDRLAMVFQEPMTALNPTMRVGRQIGEVLRLHRRLGRRETDARVVELLERVEMPDADQRAHAYPHQLSGGQRQRVMLAMALACDPAVLICDEPTTALDVTVQARVLRLVDRLVREEGTALLFITHDLAVISGLCERVLVMYGGRLVEEGPTHEVFASPSHPYTVGLLAASAGTTDAAQRDAQGRLPTIPGNVPPVHALPSGCVFRTRCPRATEVCAEPPPRVEVSDRRWVSCFHPHHEDRP